LEGKKIKEKEKEKMKLSTLIFIKLKPKYSSFLNTFKKSYPYYTETVVIEKVLQKKNNIFFFLNSNIKSFAFENFQKKKNLCKSW
jgi:hypothetical protein